MPQVKVQLLQRRLLQDEGAFAASWNWVDAFLKAEHGAASPDHYLMLRQALMARRVVLLLDGIDEGGVARERIERHVADILLPQGFTMLCTSRPSGLNEARFVSFQRLKLSPLADAQQELVVKRRLGAEGAAGAGPDRAPEALGRLQRLEVAWDGAVPKSGGHLA